MQSAKDFAIYLDNELGSGDRLFLQDCCVDDIRARDREIKKECADLAVKFLIENTRGNEMIYEDIHSFVLRDLG